MVLTKSARRDLDMAQQMKGLSRLASLGSRRRSVYSSFKSLCIPSLGVFLEYLSLNIVGARVVGQG